MYSHYVVRQWEEKCYAFFSLIKELEFKHKPGILKIWLYNIKVWQKVSRFLWMSSKANRKNEIKQHLA